MHDEIYSENDPPIGPDEFWALGLFEGEGCLTLSNGRPRIKLNSTDEDVVNCFHRIVDVGQVREDRSQEKHGYKRQWEWYAASRYDVGEFILRYWNLFGIRRRDRALELLETM